MKRIALAASIGLLLVALITASYIINSASADANSKEPAEAPNIFVVPSNDTYLSDVPLYFTIDKQTSWIGYSLDGQKNVTITGNTTIANVTPGPHSLLLYANDTSGNFGVSDMINFTKALPPTSSPTSTQQSTPSASPISPNSGLSATNTILTATIAATATAVALSVFLFKKRST